MQPYKLAQQVDGSFGVVWVGWKREGIVSVNSQEVYNLAATVAFMVLLSAVLIGLDLMFYGS